MGRVWWVQIFRKYAIAVFICIVCAIIPYSLTAGMVTQGTYSQLNSGEKDRIQIQGSDSAAYLQLQFSWSADMSPPSPDARRWSSMAYVPLVNSVILFGGDNVSSQFDDTWKFDAALSRWSQITVNGQKPDTRFGHCMISIDNDRILMFGGMKNNPGIIYYGDTWIFDCSNNTWTELSLSTAPSARSFFSMAKNSAANKVILFGGQDSNGKLQDTWIFDINASTWSIRAPATHPSARKGAAMASDGNNAIYLFGGMNSGNSELNDIWVYDTASNAWTDRNPSGTLPPVRRDHGFIYDSLNSRFLAFGGQRDNGSTLYNDAWYYSPSLNRWNTGNDTASGVPLERYGHCFEYIPSINQAVMFGGWNSVSLYDTRYFVYRSSGSYISPNIDVPFSTSLQWKTLQITRRSSISYDEIKFQIASSTDNAVWNQDDFKGPDGSSQTVYNFNTVDSQPISTTIHNNKRYLKYKAILSSGDHPYSPMIDDVTVTYNTTPGAPSLSSPIDWAKINSPTPSFSWSAASDPDGDSLAYNLMVAGQNNFSSPVINSTGIASTTYTSTTTLQHGTWYWKARAHDGTEFGAWSSTYTVYIDTIAPGAVTNLAAETGSSNGQVKLSWTSPGDNELSGNIVNGSYQVRYATYPINSEAVYASVSSQSQGDISDSYPGKYEQIPVNGLINATTYYFAVKIIDFSGNISSCSSTSPYAFTNAAPQISILSPQGGANWSLEQQIGWTSSDPNAGDSRTFSIYASTDGGSSFGVPVASGLAFGTTYYTWNTRQVSNGNSQYIKIIAVDSRGLPGENVSPAFEISNVNDSPIVTVLYPNGGETLSGAVTVQWSVSDYNLSDTHTFEVDVSSDNGLSFLSRLQTAATFYTLNTANLPNGPAYRIKVVATDPGLLTGEDISDNWFSIDNNNLPPRDFTLLYPVNSCFVSQLNLSFSWENNGDPNPEDNITYTLEISTVNTFIVSLPFSGISYSSYTINPSWLNEEATYYWKVTARDPLGLEKQCAETYRAFILSRSKTESPDGRVHIEILSGLPAGGYVKIEEIKSADYAPIKAADRDTVPDRHLKSLGEDGYRISINDANNLPLSAENILLTLKIKYPDADGDSYYDGTSVPVKNLRCAFLNETSQKWEPDSAFPYIDTASRAISATTTKIGIVAMIAALAPSSPISSVINFPNPFCPGKQDTRIRYVLTSDADVTVKIYTLTGDLVWDKKYSAGTQGGRGAPSGYTNEILWNGRNNAGSISANGMYLLEINNGSEKQVRKIGIVK